MKKQLLLLLAATVSVFAHAQQDNINDSVRLAHEVIARRIATVDIPGYIRLHQTSAALPQNQVAPAPTVPLTAADCGQISFEVDTFGGWTGYIGDNTVSSYAPLQNIQFGIFSTTPNAPINECAARHTLMTPAFGQDFCASLPVVMYGQNAARLGTNCGNYNGEGLLRTFTVGATDSVYYFSFLALLNDGGHLDGEQPYFRYLFYDSTINDTISALYVSNGDSLNGHPGTASANCIGTSVYGWYTDTLYFTPGHVIQLDITVAGCIYGGHYGYAYVDFECGGGVGIDEMELSGFSLAPNPSTGHTLLQVPATFNGEKIALRFSDISGRSIQPTLHRSSTSVEIDLSAYAPGMYFLMAEQDGKRITKKLVKE